MDTKTWPNCGHRRYPAATRCGACYREAQTLPPGTHKHIIAESSRITPEQRADNLAWAKGSPMFPDLQVER